MAKKSGWTEITLQKWIKLVQDNPDRMKGESPGGVGSRLGITRSAVQQAIDRGDLHAWRIVEPGRLRPKLRAIVVSDASVQQFRELRAIQPRRRGVQLNLLPPT